MIQSNSVVQVKKLDCKASREKVELFRGEYTIGYQAIEPCRAVNHIYLTVTLVSKFANKQQERSHVRKGSQ